MKANPILTNFTSGELSPRLKGRVDVTKYYNGCQVLENFISMTHGGVDRRPGTYFVANGKTTGKKVRLVPFEFSTTQAYILEFGENYIRVYKDRGQVTSTGTPVEITTTYSESELFDLQFAQSADTLYIAHPSHKPATLTRSSHTVWTLADITFTNSPFASSGNYPSCVAFFEQRLCWASTNNDPQKIWMSTSGDYYNFTSGTDDDSPCIYTIVSDRVNRIRWMVPSNFLFLGTVGGEFRFGGSSANDPITPTSVTAKRQSSYGCKNIQALLVGTSILYIQRSGKKVREMAYDYASDSWISKDVTILAEHITRTSSPSGVGITCSAYQQDPDSIMWAVREDGVLLGMTYEPTQQVVGWHRHTTDGTFESVAVIPGVGEDEVWVSVLRGTKRCIEYMKTRDFGDQRDAFFVDSGVTYDGGAAVTITGASNTNPVVITATNSFADGDKVRIQNVQGMTEINGIVYTVTGRAAGSFSLSGVNGTGYGVWVAPGDDDETPTVEKVANTFTGATQLASSTAQAYGDGGAIADVTVDGAGAFTTPSYYNTLHVGRGYTSTLLPMEIEAGATMGTSQGETKRVYGLAVKVYNSLPFQQGPTLDSLLDVPFEVNSDLFSGDIFIEFDGDYGFPGNVYIVQEQPNPLTVLSIMPKLETVER